jgi:hypothetical protein
MSLAEARSCCHWSRARIWQSILSNAAIPANRDTCSLMSGLGRPQVFPTRLLRVAAYPSLWHSLLAVNLATLGYGEGSDAWEDRRLRDGGRPADRGPGWLRRLCGLAVLPPLRFAGLLRRIAWRGHQRPLADRPRVGRTLHEAPLQGGTRSSWRPSGKLRAAR